ncbi:adhesion G-protein coupled receptor V1-like [Amphiura filiformis]|uniref:adhesion G-protein coupled receptor V1-like n=1 Tax=Amphiura filiformis TaxID=82378 RepID=UPI003B2212A8
MATIFILDKTAWYYIEETQYIVGEEAGTLRVRICRDGYHDVAGSVAFTATGVTADGGGVDFQAPNGVATFAVDVECVDKQITIVCDDEIELLETFTITLNPATAVEGIIGSPSSATVYIIDETSLFHFEESQYIVCESAGSLDVRIRRSGYYLNTNSDPVKVGVTFQANTATGGDVDFDANGVTEASFSAGQYFDVISIDINTDNECEDLESFTISLDNPTYACSAISCPSTTTVYIIDKTAWFAIEQSVYVVGERCGTLDVGILRGGYLSETLEVSVEMNIVDVSAEGTGADADYSAPAVKSTFAPGDTYMTKQFTINTDALIENIEKFTITLQTNTRGEIKEPNMATVYILDETTCYYIEEGQYVVGERIGTLDVQIKRCGYLSSAGSVDLNIQDDTATVGVGNDYTSPTTTVSFAAGEHTVEKTFTILTDGNREALETFTIQLQNAAAGDLIHEPMMTTVFIVDETARLYLQEAQFRVREGDGSLAVLIRRDGYIWDEDDVTVNLALAGTATGGGTDYTVQPTNPVTFTGGDYKDFLKVNFDITDDNILEDTETVIITLNNPSSEVFIDNPSISTVYIEDQTALIQIENAIYIVGERTGMLTVRICRTGYLWDAAVSVDLNIGAAGDTATNVNDYIKTSPVSNTITFTPGQKCIDVDFTIVTDAILENSEYFTITIDTPVEGSICSPSTAVVFIWDQTAAFWIEAQYIAHEDVDLIVTAHREGYIDETDILTLSATAGSASINSDYALPANLKMTFNPGDTSTTSMAITIKPDAVIEDIEEFFVSMTLDSATTANRGVILLPNPSTVFIFDRTSYFWIEENKYIIDEDNILDVVFHRGGFLGRTETLTLSATDGRAIDTIDYILPGDKTITFNAGDTTSSKSIGISDDNIFEHWEDFSISIAIDVGSSTSGVLASPSMSLVIIRDPTWYHLDCVRFFVWEYETVVNVVIRREGDITVAGSVAIITADGSAVAGDNDYVPISTASVIDFNSGVSEVNVPISILQDDLVEADEVLYVSLLDPSTGESLGDLHKGTVTIFDDDAYYALEKQLYHLKEATVFLVINILRVGYTDIDGAVELNTRDICAVNGVDYSGFQNVLLQFDSGQKTISYNIPILNDALVEEDNDWFEIFLTNPTQGQLASTRSASVCIKDDDSLIFFRDESYHVLENGLEVSITVVRIGCLEQPASIVITTSGISADGSIDYTEETRTIVFAVGESSFTFTIPISDDDIVEQTESFEIIITSAQGSEIGHPASANVFIENDDVSYCFADSAYFVNETKREVLVTVVRKGYLGNPSSIAISTRDGTAISTSTINDFVSFSSRNVGFSRDQTAVTLGVTIVDDGNYELAEMFQVVLLSSVIGELSIPDIATVTILSDDDPCERGCMNGGVCINPDECACPDEFTGTYCEIDVDECQTNANLCIDITLVCVNTVGSYRCECANPSLQLIGNRCEAELIDECPIGYCFNGGVCVASASPVDNYACICAAGFSGNRCETIIGGASNGNIPSKTISLKRI